MTDRLDIDPVSLEGIIRASQTYVTEDLDIARNISGGR